ncbi:hypothetical protein BTA51_17940 [Hahella sp. CCB-MM4]|uniref:putative hydro-lyase n=1 Tax=Hahella sp. (strain CCB-MM4) TaxID=1926491 RepID=UPI000B9AB5FC|nr:putative hydro-lyase [Hahella sp. CCB-MM4]OZG71888.1 hypothetical protein BTA51_17940 [Hahella sp. CCB-MM4]
MISIKTVDGGFRGAIRSGSYTGQTSGMAPGYVQANLAIFPKDWAEEFLRFCLYNPKPCPLLGVTEPGNPKLPMLGTEIDLCTDLPLYRVWRDGLCVDELSDIRHLWRDDLVGFAIGCSFSFEQALQDAGIRLRHIDQGRNVSMYRTNIPCLPAGRFSGSLVVSMRPMKAADAIRAIQVCSRFPNVHGAPVHIGNPAQIGIADISQPDYGDPTEILDDEIPLFWGCGVTPQAIISEVKPPFCITHSPGSMLITDLLNGALAVL